MVFELHIWGPAFSLPSIDPECLAAVAYLSQVVPEDQWILVASNDLLMSPTSPTIADDTDAAITEELPALRDGDNIVAGYTSIVSHLRTVPNAQYDLDTSLSPLQMADSTAFSCLLTTSLGSLLCLSHYVSSENYTTTTRPTLSKLLDPPFHYIIPPQFRAAAKIRTEHLGLSVLDVDTAAEEQKSKGDAMPGSDQIPRSLRNSIRQTVGTAVRQPNHAAQFRLSALMDSVFGPLSELLGDRQFLLGVEQMTGLDCLALGYLAMVLVPEMPQAWLVDTMKKKYPSLLAFGEAGIKRCFGSPVRPEDPVFHPEHKASGEDGLGFYEHIAPASEKSILPWKIPPPTDLLSTSTTLLSYTLPSVPFIGALYQSPILLRKEESHSPASAPVLGPALLTLSAAAAAVGSYFLYSVLASPHDSYSSAGTSEKKYLGDMGEAGAMLAMVDFRDEYSTQQHENISKGQGVVPVVELDVAVKDKP